MIESLHSFDVELFLKIHRGLSNGFFDWLMPLLRNRFFWAPLYVFIIIYSFRAYKKNGWYVVGGLLFTFAMGDLIASRLIKQIVARIRPCNEPTLVNDIVHRVPCGTGYSFPSAHATNHFALALFLILVFYKVWKPVLPLGLLWAFSIAFAQIYVGVHYPIDVFCGALLGLVIGFSCFKLVKILHPEL